MNLMKYKGYTGTVEFSADDNILYGKVTGINGLISYEGKNSDELCKNFKASVEDYLEMCEENEIMPQFYD